MRTIATCFRWQPGSLSFLLLLAVFAVSLAFSGPSVAQTLTIPHQIEAASTACTDGTQVFALYGNGVANSKLYIIKDNGAIAGLVYSNDYYEDIQRVYSIACLKHAIVLYGAHGMYLSTSVVTIDSNDQIKVELVAGHRAPPQIKSSASKTIVDIFGDDRNGLDKTIVKELVFEKDFLVPGDMAILVPVPGFAATYAGGGLTSAAHCYNSEADSDYTVVAYTKGGVSSVVVSEAEEGGTSYPLAFAATNSICVAGNTYLFGKGADGHLKGAVYHYSKQKMRLEDIVPEEAPLQPYME